MNQKIQRQQGRRWFLLLGLAVGASAVAAGFRLVKPTLDQDHRTNLGYLAWKRGWAAYRPEFSALMVRDFPFTRRLQGQPFAELAARLGIPAYDGTKYPANTYRGRYQARLREHAPQTICQWLDDRADSFGVCFWVEAGQIRKLVTVKG